MDKAEVLRYLGYKNQILDDKTDYMINQCIDEIYEISDEKYLYNTFHITDREQNIILNNGLMELPGASIKKHLENSEQCILMAVTLGASLDKRIRYYEKTNLSMALILDACGTALVEELANKTGDIIGNELQGSCLTFRFSPGYGDLPITIQKKFLKVLHAEKKIGLTASEESILFPRKSVTAVVGIVKERNSGEKGCKTCNKKDCQYKKEDN